MSSICGSRRLRPKRRTPLKQPPDIRYAAQPEASPYMLRAYKSRGNKSTGGNRAFLAKLRRLREDGAKLTGLPEGVTGHLEAANELLQGTVATNKNKAKRNASERKVAGFKIDITNC